MTQSNPQESGTIRITEADASSTHVDDLLKRQASLRGETGITRDRGRNWFYQSWFVLMIAGLFSAFLGWMLIESFYDDFLYVEGTIAEIKPVAEFPGAYGTIRVGDSSYLVFKESRAPGERGQWTPIDFESLKQGDRVGVYADSPERAGLPEGAPPVALFVKPGASTGAGDNLEKAARLHGFGNWLFFSVVAGTVGLLLGAADGLICRLPRRALLGGAVGLVVGLIGGFIFNCFANLAYSPLAQWASQHEGAGAGGLSTTGFLIQLGARGLGWMLAGISMGLGQGLALRSGKILLYGFLGGLIGGLVGGLLFDPINFFVSGQHQPSAALSRAISITVIGGSVGLMIGIVELLARDAWLRMVAGPLAGKEFLIFKSTMNVGASPRSDIYLFNDQAVAQTHGIIRATGDTYEIEGTSDVHPLTVNNRAVKRTRLRHGDQIGLGRTVFVFQRKRG